MKRTVAGRRHHSANGGRQRAFPGNRRVQDAELQNRHRPGYCETRVPVALGDMETGELRNLWLTRAKLLEHFGDGAAPDALAQPSVHRR